MLTRESARAHGADVPTRVPVTAHYGRAMSVQVVLHGGPEGGLRFDEADLPAGSGGTYGYHVGSGGELIVLVDERGESRVQQVFGPTTWHSVTGDVWRKGMLLR